MTHLLDQGEASCPNRIARLARMAGIKAQIGCKRRPNSYGGEPSVVVDNTLAQQFDVDAPDRAWMTDIINIRTQEGFAYLAMAIDLFSRRLLGQPEAAMVALDGWRDGLALVGLETGATSEWIGGHLVNDGSPVFCLESRYVQAALSATTVKTGWRDAQGIAQTVRAQLTNDKVAGCTLAA